MSFKCISILSSGGRFVQRSCTISTVSVVGHPRQISVKLFWNRSIGLGGDAILMCFFSIFSSGGHFIQWRGTILAIMVEGHQRNSSVKYF